MSDFILVPDSPFRYRITSTGAGSAKLGNCEICNQPAADIHIISIEQAYEITPEMAAMLVGTPLEDRIKAEQSWRSDICLFGHEDCLLRQVQPGGTYGRATRLDEK